MAIDGEKETVGGEYETSGPSGESQLPDGSTAPEAQYDFSIDLDSDNTHASVVRLVGTARRVLELGPATGYMSAMFRERGATVVGIELDPEMAARAEAFCERVIVGDLDELDLEATFGEERFDAIVAADVLEHLRDPLMALRRLRPYLSPDGFFVVSLPNIAHGSVRLSLLEGHFDYRDLGLLDRTHLRFFTYDSIARLFDDAELGIAELHRQDAPIAATEIPVDLGTVPEAALREIERDPNAHTYQFVIKAIPLERSGLREIQRRLREHALARDSAEAEAAGLRAEVERLSVLEQQLVAMATREGEVRTALVDAHDGMLRRDEEIHLLQEEIQSLREELKHQANRLAQEHHEDLQDHLQRAHESALGEVAARDEQIRRLRLRLDRIVNSGPYRAYLRVGQLPGFRRVLARRTADYNSAARRPDDSGG